MPVVLFALALAGCAPLPPAPDYTGQRINDVIEDWGFPNSIYREPTDYHGGLARYEEKNPYEEAALAISCKEDAYGNVDDHDCTVRDGNSFRKSQWDLGAQARGGRCIIDVKFDSTGVVTDIAAKNQSCVRNAQAGRYSE